MITTGQLHIGYSDTLLKVEDMTLNSGLYILIGKNGSGKSTFLKTITGQIPPISGNVTLNGTDVSEITVAQMPKVVSFVHSQFPVVEFLRTEEFIGLARSPYTRFFGTINEKDAAAVENAMKTLNISHLKGRFTSELSDGERQLVAIAKALAQETSIIALDEPTAFLDYSNKKLVLENLLHIAKEFGKCILLSSHDIDLSLEANCPFLVVNPKEKSLRLKEASISKKELLDIAFNQ